MTGVAVLTPPGRSALATLAIRGEPAWQVVRQHFRPALPERPTAGSIWLGRLGREVADEVVLVGRGDDPVALAEIHCHGGPEVVRFLIELFLEQGISEGIWQEHLASTLPPDRAQAAIALTQATTDRVASLFLARYHGAATEPCAVPDHKLLAGFRVVLAGAPNVGKSSLANALAGYQRSIVSATPGTTRDVVTLPLALDGWPIELCDTAGLRDATGLEGAGVEQSRALLATADLVVWLVDATDPHPVLPDWPGALLVVNKIDQPAAWPIPGDALTISATTGQGLESLVAAIVGRLVPGSVGQRRPG